MLKEKVNRVKHTTIKHLGYSLTPPFPELQFREVVGVGIAQPEATLLFQGASHGENGGTREEAWEVLCHPGGLVQPV